MADIDKLFEQVSSEILTEEMKLSLAVMFENQLNEAIKLKEEQLQEDNKKEISTFKESLIEKIDQYLTFFSEEFVKSNQMAIQESVKTKTAERVLKAFDALMKDFHYQLDEKKVTSDDKLVEYKKEINTLTKQLIESRENVKKVQKAAMVVEASTKLDTDLQKASLVEYAKRLEFDEMFESKIKAHVTNMLTEAKHQAKEQKSQTKLIVEEQVVPEKKVVVEEKTTVDKYLENL